jgi:hypothetical protein
MLVELLKREKEAGIKPDPDTDIFLKVIHSSSFPLQGLCLDEYHYE